VVAKQKKLIQQGETDKIHSRQRAVFVACGAQALKTSWTKPVHKATGCGQAAESAVGSNTADFERLDMLNQR